MVDGPNLYLYCKNDAINYYDPDGNVAIVDDAVYVVVGVGVCVSYVVINTDWQKAGEGLASGFSQIGNALGNGMNNIVKFAKGGNQNVKDTGLEGVSDEEVSRSARDKSLSPEERLRYQREEKARGLRNKNKRNAGAGAPVTKNNIEPASKCKARDK
jgi:hypothetical protein